jgi:hypothetical protein
MSIPPDTLTDLCDAVEAAQEALAPLPPSWRRCGRISV